MPNYCDFQVKLTGYIENIIRFYNACNVPYHGDEHDPEHFYRVFNIVIEEIKPIDKPQFYQAYMSGYCAWSITSCFMENGYHETNRGGKGITLCMLSEYCPELVIEMFSTEPGMQFSEHILVKDNTVFINECNNYYELDKETSLEVFNELTNLDWDQKQFNNYFSYNDYYEYYEEPIEWKDHSFY